MPAGLQRLRLGMPGHDGCLRRRVQGWPAACGVRHRCHQLNNSWLKGVLYSVLIVDFPLHIGCIARAVGHYAPAVAPGALEQAGNIQGCANLQ